MEKDDKKDNAVKSPKGKKADKQSTEQVTSKEAAMTTDKEVVKTNPLNAKETNLNVKKALNNKKEAENKLIPTNDVKLKPTPAKETKSPQVKPVSNGKSKNDFAEDIKGFPSGWKKGEAERDEKKRIFLLTPDGKKFWQKDKLNKHLESNPSLTNSGRT